MAVPAETPETVPFEETLAMSVLFDDHVPPEVGSAKRVVLPTQTVNEPVIAPTLGTVLTVTVLVTVVVPQLLVTA